MLQFFAAQQLAVWWCNRTRWSECENGTDVQCVALKIAQCAWYLSRSSAVWGAAR